MELLWSLGLIVIILLALNHMAGGNPSAVLRPTSRLVSNVVGGVLRLVAGLFGSVFKIGASSMKLPKSDDHKDTRGPGPPPPRWD